MQGSGGEAVSMERLPQMGSDSGQCSQQSPQAAAITQNSKSETGPADSHDSETGNETESENAGSLAFVCEWRNYCDPFVALLFYAAIVTNAGLLAYYSDDDHIGIGAHNIGMYIGIAAAITCTSALIWLACISAISWRCAHWRWLVPTLLLCPTLLLGSGIWAYTRSFWLIGSLAIGLSVFVLGHLFLIHVKEPLAGSLDSLLRAHDQPAQLPIRMLQICQELLTDQIALLFAASLVMALTMIAYAAFVFTTMARVCGTLLHDDSKASCWTAFCYFLLIGLWGLEVFRMTAHVVNCQVIGQIYRAGSRKESLLNPLGCVLKALSKLFGSICLASLLSVAWWLIVTPLTLGFICLALLVIPVLWCFPRILKAMDGKPFDVKRCFTVILAACSSLLGPLSFMHSVPIGLHEKVGWGDLLCYKALRDAGLAPLVEFGPFHQAVSIGSFGIGCFVGVVVGLVGHENGDFNQDEAIAWSLFTLTICSSAIQIMLTPFGSTLIALITCFAEDPVALHHKHRGTYDNLIEAWRVAGGPIVGAARIAENKVAPRKERKEVPWVLAPRVLVDVGVPGIGMSSLLNVLGRGNIKNCKNVAFKCKNVAFKHPMLSSEKRLTLVDQTPEQLRFVTASRNMTHGVTLALFDIRDKESLLRTLVRMKRIRPPLILVGTRLDQSGNFESVLALAKHEAQSLGIPFVAVSAVEQWNIENENDNIEELRLRIVEACAGLPRAPAAQQHSNALQQHEDVHLFRTASATTSGSQENICLGWQCPDERKGAWLRVAKVNTRSRTEAEHQWVKEAALLADKEDPESAKRKTLLDSAKYDFTDLCSEGAGTEIRDTARRAISLEQLQLVAGHVIRRILAKEEWERNFSVRKVIEFAEEVNLYDIQEWVVCPATIQTGLSMVEIMSTHEQIPDFFCSHWWGESILQFLVAVEQHAYDYGLESPEGYVDGEVVSPHPDFLQGRSPQYWVCIHANRQHDLEAEIGDGALESTSFFRAIQLAKGTISIVDPGAVVFSRIWCDYELYISLKQVKKQHKSHDMYTAVNHVYTCPVTGTTQKRYAAGIVTGKLAVVDINTATKLERETHFPIKLLEDGISFEVKNAQASVPRDKEQIIKAITKHQLLDDRVHGVVAAAGIVRALENDGNVNCLESQQWLLALAKGHLQTILLDFSGSCADTEENCQAVLMALGDRALCADTQKLSELQELVINGATKLTNSCLATLSKDGFNQLNKLDLWGCNGFSSLPDIAHLKELTALNLKSCSGLQALPELTQLQKLDKLVLRYCNGLQSLPDLSHCKALRLLNLSECTGLATPPDVSQCYALTELNMSNCHKISCAPNLPQYAVLTTLSLAHCKNIVSIPDLSHVDTLITLELYGCSALQSIPGLSNLGMLEELHLKGCSSLEMLPDLCQLTSLRILDLGMCCSFHTLPALKPLPALATLNLLCCPAGRSLTESDVLYLEENGCNVQRSECQKADKLTEIVVEVLKV